MKRLLKPVVALVAVIGLLGFLAPPSAASTGIPTGGTLTIGAAPYVAHNFGINDCSSSITMLDDSTGTSGSTPVAGTFAMNLDFAFLRLGLWYHFVGTANGVYNSTHNANSTYNLAVHVNLIANIYLPADQMNPCASGTRVCGPIVANSFNLAGVANLTAVHPGPVGTIHLAGNRVVNAFGCGAPFNSMNGSIATIASLTANLA